MRANVGCRHVVTGTLKGYDALMNLVLDDVQEVMRGELIPRLPHGLSLSQLLPLLHLSGD